MKLKLSLYTAIFMMAGIVISCGTNVNLTNPDITDSTAMAVGTDSTFDIITWNIENFPKSDPDTSELLETLLPNLKADCIAVQEVRNSYAFYTLVNQMPGWSYRISGSGDTQTAILYNTATVSVDSSATIFPGMSNPFPRPPLLMKIRWQNQEMIIISLHLKAYGDNYIDESDNYDEEVRRRYACQLLDEYISTYFPDSRVMVVGDMNDQIQEPAAYNVFLSFLDKPDEYYFADMSIAQHLTSQNCSYPTSSSHIDHILITNELFQAFKRGSNFVKTVQMENYIAGGWYNYDKYISDHRPVAARFNFSTE